MLPLPRVTKLFALPSSTPRRSAGLALLPLLGSLGSACGESDSPAPATTTLDAKATCQRLLSAACSRVSACGAVHPLGDGGQVCLTDADCAAVLPMLSQECEARAAAGATYASSDVDACASALGAASCDTVCTTSSDPAECAPFQTLTSGGSSPPVCDPACRR